MFYLCSFIQYDLSDCEGRKPKLPSRLLLESEYEDGDALGDDLAEQITGLTDFCVEGFCRRPVTHGCVVQRGKEYWGAGTGGWIKERSLAKVFMQVRAAKNLVATQGGVVVDIVQGKIIS
jgi:hypothetical protein